MRVLATGGLLLLLTQSMSGSPGYSDKATLATKPPRVVNAGIYIEKSLWKVIEEIAKSDKESDVLEFLKVQLETIFNLANQKLRNLDDGGFKVKYNKTIQRLESSDVKIKKTYVDRLNRNKTKEFDHSDIFSHTFTFQEAVEKMPNRHDVDVRLLFLLERDIENPANPVKAAAEEHCICDPDWFGCVLILSLTHPDDWARSSNLLAHEFGLTLGAEMQDNAFYDRSMKDDLIMWSEPSPTANVWSEKAREQIKDHDLSCLSKEKKGAAVEKKDEDQAKQ